MEEVIRLSALLPKYEEIKNILQNDPEANYILKLAIAAMNRLRETLEEGDPEEAHYLVQCLVDKYWERIHTGPFSEVPVVTRQIYALGNFYKIFFMLFESLSERQVEKCAEIMDDALLLGCTKDLYSGFQQLQSELSAFLSKSITDPVQIELPVIAALPRQEFSCDIDQVHRPSIEDFREKFFRPQKPALLLDTISHWPAMEKWRDLNYILTVAGNRTVPIEIGSNYATDEWSQQLVKIRDFLRRQFGGPTKKNSNDAIEYLAQHELFDQIPELKADIRTPDYCDVGANAGKNVEIKAWLGPKGTISPMHYDPKHNLLCQVFGVKKIILAAPKSTANLYPHETEFLGNTSQIDAANIDVERFPLTKQERFYNLSLQAGDCLYLPPKWWHYVRAESESFSVSFWWE